MSQTLTVVQFLSYILIRDKHVAVLLSSPSIRFCPFVSASGMTTPYMRDDDDVDDDVACERQGAHRDGN